MIEIGIFVGTVYGNALFLAEKVELFLKKQKHTVKLFKNPTFIEWEKYTDKIVLIITSTTGNGDFPNNIIDLINSIKKDTNNLDMLRYGIIGLGDKSYDVFCGAGKNLDIFLQKKRAQRIYKTLLIDAMQHPNPIKITLNWINCWNNLL